MIIVFKVVRGNLYSPEGMVEFLTTLGIINPVEIIKIIKEKGLGLIGDVRILYVPK